MPRGYGTPARKHIISRYRWVAASVGGLFHLFSAWRSCAVSAGDSSPASFAVSVVAILHATRPDVRLPAQAGFRYLRLHGLSSRSAPSDFTVRRLAITRGDQFFLKLQPFVECHGGLFALRRQIFYREINTCF